MWSVVTFPHDIFKNHHQSDEHVSLKKEHRFDGAHITVVEQQEIGTSIHFPIPFENRHRQIVLVWAEAQPKIWERRSLKKMFEKCFWASAKWRVEKKNVLISTNGRLWDCFWNNKRFKIAFSSRTVILLRSCSRNQIKAWCGAKNLKLWSGWE